MTSPLDHLVLAGPDLAALVAWFTERTGVVPAPGGRHVGLGTANRLVGLGGSAYLELIGPDPDAPDPDRPRPFGIDALTGNRLVTWAVRRSDLDVPGYDGPAPMSRRTADGDLLSWRLAFPPGPSGVLPFLIDWGSTPHPTTRDLPELPLRWFRGTHPAPDRVNSVLTSLGAEWEVAEGPERLTADVGGLVL
ncbi:VOC family protein [Actinosynnema sp. NPDC020468]|uniref:VOC family protein n=1 Tax=Actinosynnema sp. NPDC020468 TaxID=3154488 RepID=UPI00340CB5FE